jgi:hypothetical protein
MQIFFSTQKGAEEDEASLLGADDIPVVQHRPSLLPRPSIASFSSYDASRVHYSAPIQPMTTQEILSSGTFLCLFLSLLLNGIWCQTTSGLFKVHYFEKCRKTHSPSPGLRPNVHPRRLLPGHRQLIWGSGQLPEPNFLGRRCRPGQCHKFLLHTFHHSFQSFVPLSLSDLLPTGHERCMCRRRRSHVDPGPG